MSLREACAVGVVPEELVRALHVLRYAGLAVIVAVADVAGRVFAGTKVEFDEQAVGCDGDLTTTGHGR